jgi:hypothetical protein
MKRPWTARFCGNPIVPCWVAGLTLSGGAAISHGAEDFAAPIRPLLEAYCIKCHGGEKTEAGADLTGLTGELDLLVARGLWESVVEQVETGEMPPKGPYPTDGERTRLAGWIRGQFDGIDWSKYRSPGHVTMPRLTKSEYRNTLRDLLGVDLRAGEDLPDDGEGKSGFTNDRDSLSLTSSQLEQYFLSAERAIDGVFALARPLISPRIEAEAMDRSPPKLEPHGDGVVIVHPDHELKTEWDFPADGWYTFRIAAAALGGKPCVVEVRVDGESVASARVTSGDLRRAPVVEARGFVRAGRHSVTLQSRNLVPQTPLPPDIVRLVDDRAREIAPRLSALAEHEPAALRKAREELNHKAWGVQESFEWLRALGPGGDPRQIDLRRTYLEERQAKWNELRDKLAAEAGIPASEIDRRWAEQNGERLADNARLLDAVAEVQWDDWMRWQGKLFVDWLEIEGPVRPGPPSGGWTLLDALKATDGTPEALLKELLPRAFRRPVSADEVARYEGLVRETMTGGETREHGLAVALTAILTSPRFLYRDELPGAGDEGGRDRMLDGMPWLRGFPISCGRRCPMPNCSIWRRQDLLSDPATLAAQADRMLDDPKADAFFEAFTFDWLGIRELGRGIRPDQTKFPEFTPDLASPRCARRRFARWRRCFAGIVRCWS